MPLADASVAVRLTDVSKRFPGAAVPAVERLSLEIPRGSIVGLIEAYGQDLVDVLDALSAAITTEDLIAWNVETDLEFREPADVAREWLEAEGLLG